MGKAMSPSPPDSRLTLVQAQRFAKLPLAGLPRVYPNHLMHLMTGAADIGTPEELHPVFYGCYDWHSAVHGFWLLARCLRRHADLPLRGEIESLFDRHLTVPAGEKEAAYFTAAGRQAFERPYGWAWLLALAGALRTWSHPKAAGWAAALAPLERFIVAALPDYLKRLSYPIRAGVHSNTAFALVLALHYARSTADPALARALAAAALGYYRDDRDYPAHYEPSGDDFLSGGLIEALLMSSCLPTEDFTAWFAAFLPDYAAGRAGPYDPAVVSDRSDAKIVHLDGLNLSRSWCLRGIAAALPPGHTARAALQAASQTHQAASLPHIDSGDFVGEHWLASFALLAIEGLG
jgi:hypothetical protein